MMPEPVTPDAFRAALGRFATGVTVVTVRTSEEAVHGMTANAFCSVSLHPPLVLVCVDHLAETYLHLREHGQFGVSVLKLEQEALSEFFADPERNPDAAYRLGVEYRKMKSGIPGTIPQNETDVQRLKEDIDRPARQPIAKEAGGETRREQGIEHKEDKGGGTLDEDGCQ